MKRPSKAKIFLAVAIALLVLSVVLSVVGLFPVVTGTNEKTVIIDGSFRLSQNEVYKQGLGEFHGGENITLALDCQTASMKNFSITSTNITFYSNLSNLNTTFTAGTSYYEVIFYSNATQQSWIHLQVTVEKQQVLHPLAWLSASAKIMFLLSAGAAAVIILRMAFPQLTEKLETTPNAPSLNRTFRNRLLAFVLLSLVVWLVFLAANSSPLATFNNWYTDHVRDDYVSSLFLKDGLSVFNQPLGVLSSQDTSHYMFVTWPEMPHLYPLGSILVFLPFGALLQNGFDHVLTYKLEIALFLVFAHICLYFFLRNFLNKNAHVFWKVIGVFIMYVSLVIYAAGGMFDSVAFLFALIAVTMFLSERYDVFFFLLGVSVFLKYQAGIFLLPLAVVGLLRLFEKNKPVSLLHNKAVVVGAVLVSVSVFTAYLSAPFIMQTRPELIMNNINAFAPHAQIDWIHQAVYVLLTLTATLAYAAYMLNKNRLLSLSAIFLLLPSFMLPYFQYWYTPFIFVYALIPQKKREVEVTVVWLIFMVAALSGFFTNPLQIFDGFRSILRI